MINAQTERIVEDAALALLSDHGWETAYGPEISPNGLHPERNSFRDAVLIGRLQDAVDFLNPGVPAEAKRDAIAKALATSGQSLVHDNHSFYRMLVDGISVEYRRDGQTVHDLVRLVDFNRPMDTDFLAVNQLTVDFVDGGGKKHRRRLDLVLFVNGCPLVVFEFKDPSSALMPLEAAFHQIQTYQREGPDFFRYNAFNVLSDGLSNTRFGSITANEERYMAWHLARGGSILANEGENGLEIITAGLLCPDTVLRYLAGFIVFQDELGTVSKKIAAPHQFYAVEATVVSTIRALAPGGDQKAGVVWHTQGSGKTLTMGFYAGRLIREPALSNPTIVFLTDRNDLDNQLYENLAMSSELLGQDPTQADSVAELRSLLRVASGGVICTTIEKFKPNSKHDRHPVISPRSNIVVVADEAHRSQYALADGYAAWVREALPHATFVGFTGTPIATSDIRNTKIVFGDYTSIYDVRQSQQDGATVKIAYEPRIIKLDLPEDNKLTVDEIFEEVTEGEEEAVRLREISKWGRVEALLGSEPRIRQLVEDMVKHIEARLAAVKGKVMIVAASRRIAVLLYDEIAKIRPDWVSEDENRGRMKVVMTGSASDPPEFQRHVRTKAERREIERRFKDPGDELQVVIVRDMWLTGFDVPPLHTMYIDKPMQGYGLMQAIARVNRVFGDKPGGLVVDYIGIGGELRKAVAEYSTSVGTGVAALQPEQVAEALQECSEVAEGLIHPYDCLDFEVADAAGKMRLAREVADHVLAMRGGEGVPDGRDRFLKAVTALRRAYALAAPSPLANEVKPTLVFLRVVASLLAPIKEPRTSANRATALDQEVEQLVSEAVVGEGVENILMLDGRIGIDALSDEFLQGIDQLPQKNLAAEMLRRLLEEEIARIARHSVVQGRKFSEALEKALIKYKNGLIDSAALIKTLVEFAQEIKAEANRGAELGMQSDEVAFYDALAVSESAVNVLGDAVLRKMAHRLVDLVRKNATIDWSRRESARANMRRLVKRVLREFQYPPDQEAAATEMVLSQAILLTDAVTGEEDPD